LSLLQVLLPGAPFASFLSSASPAAEEGKGEREKSDGGMRACRMGELKKLITRVGGGRRVVRREEDGEREDGCAAAALEEIRPRFLFSISSPGIQMAFSR